MEPAEAKVMLAIGRFPVVEVVSETAFRVKLGPGTTFVLHVRGFKHSVKPDDMIHLYAEVPYAPTQSTSVQ